MGLLVESIQARRAIEVGTFTGYSSIAIAQVRGSSCARALAAARLPSARDAGQSSLLPKQSSSVLTQS